MELWSRGSYPDTRRLGLVCSLLHCSRSSVVELALVVRRVICCLGFSRTPGRSFLGRHRCAHSCRVVANRDFASSVIKTLAVIRDLISDALLRDGKTF
jgi:hypothetical protein